MNYEIERKFLLDKFPEFLQDCPYQNFIQAYLLTEPVVRIRQEGTDYVLTYKSKGLLKRREENLELTKEGFHTLLPKCDGILITKRRYTYPLEAGLIAEVDVFEGQHKGLILVEVEFDNLEQSQNFQPPSWFGKEVTTDPCYYNSYLSTHPYEKV